MGNPLPDTGVIEVDETPIYVVASPKAMKQWPDAAKIKITNPVIALKLTKLAAPIRMDDFPVAAELGRSRLIPVDLSAVVNASLADDGNSRGWTSEGPFNDARMVPTGNSAWLGVPFNIAGKKANDPSIITMFGRNSPSAPRSVTVAMHDTRSRGLFFAHSATWASGKIGDYVVSYVDGHEQVLPIVVGENIGDWWSDHAPAEQSRTVAFTHPNPLETDKPYRFLRIWYWENPRSDVAIRSITIRKSSDTTNFVLLALTRTTW